MKRRLLASLPFALVLSCGPPSADVVVVVPGSSDAPALVTASPSVEPAPEPVAAAGEISWEAEGSVARERAKTRGAPLLVFAFAAWSTAAVRMDRTTWADPRVIQRARPFVALRLDVSEADANAQASSDEVGVRVLPSVVFLDDLGHELTRVEGYAGPEEILAAMGRVLPGH